MLIRPEKVVSEQILILVCLIVGYIRMGKFDFFPVFVSVNLFYSNVT